MGEHLVMPGPWFRAYPRTAAAVAAGLLVFVTVVRFVSGDEREATALLFALPVTLVALAFGQAAGTLGAIGAIFILGIWVVIVDVDLTPMGWASRVLPLVLLGFLVGRSSDQLVDAEAAGVALAVGAVRRRDAAEINDDIVQRLTVAKWSVEAGRCDEALTLLEDAIGAGQRLVTALLDDVDVEDRRQVRSVPAR